MLGLFGMPWCARHDTMLESVFLGWVRQSTVRQRAVLAHQTHDSGEKISRKRIGRVYSSDERSDRLQL